MPLYNRRPELPPILAPAPLGLADLLSRVRQALQQHLPSEILHRRKMGFVTPISGWFRGPLAHAAASIGRQSKLVQTGWFDDTAIARVAAEHQAGKADHGRLLWQLLMLDKSLKRVFGPAS